MYYPNEKNAKSRTLYIGNLDPSVTEELLLALFTQIGPCNSCKIIHDPTGDPYAFIEFAEYRAASRALLAMDKRLVMGKEIKVNIAEVSAYATIKAGRDKYSHIYVGDLAPDIDENILHKAFSPYGEIVDIRIAKNPDSQTSKGYCFIAFVNKNDAENAIANMNGQWLGTKKIRTNWAAKKASTNGTANSTRYRDANSSQNDPAPKPDYNVVWNRTTDTNSVVYFGDYPDVSEDFIRSIFAPFGDIKEIRVFGERGYAFIQFTSKESACQAICHIHGLKINGCTVRCSWGREEMMNKRNNNMKNQNYNNNQYDSYSQNSYGPLSNNNYMDDDGSGYHDYDDSYQQPNNFQQQYYNSQQWDNNINGPQVNPMWNPHSQSMVNNGGWNNNTNNDYYDSNFNQYNNSQQSHMYSSNSGWDPSQG